jgi:uroporphyrinogen-III decarboxylase
MYREFVLPYGGASAGRSATPAPSSTRTPAAVSATRIDLLAETATGSASTPSIPSLSSAIARTKARLRPTSVLQGNINSVALLDFRVKKSWWSLTPLVIGKPGAGYILSTACSVAPRVEALEGSSCWRR